MKSQTIKILETEFNPVYLPFLESKARTLVFYGGAGSGKSHFIAQKLVFECLRDRGRNFAVLRKVKDSHRGSTYAQIKKVIQQWGLSHLFKILQSPLEIRCLNGNMIVFHGLDDVQKLKSITFETGDLTNVWVEEASEIKETDLNQIYLRQRGKSRFRKQLTLSFNPISHLHWLKKYFFDNPKPDTVILKTTYLENRFLSANDRQIIEGMKEKDHSYYMIYALGEWGVLGNLIITNWQEKAIPTDPRFYDEILQGLDFGYNHPSAWVKVGVKHTAPDELFFFQDYKRSGVLNRQLIEDLKPLIGSSRVWADSAEPDRIREFQMAGCTNVLPVTKGKSVSGAGFVKSGIEYLRSKKIWVHPQCIDTKNQWELWKYKEDSFGNSTDEPVDLNDDIAAAARYAVHEKARHWAGFKIPD